MNDELLTMDEVAEMLGAHRSSVYNWIRSGRLDPPIRIGPRKVAYKRSTIQDFIDSCEPTQIGAGK